MTLFAHDLGSSPVRDSEPAGGRRASARGEVARTPVDRVVADGPIERLLPSISARILKASHEELDAVVLTACGRFWKRCSWTAAPWSKCSRNAAG